MKNVSLCVCVLFLLASQVGSAQERESQLAREGYLTTPDGVRLWYSAVGDGDSTVLLPGAAYLLDDFRRLAVGRKIIAYDLRNRGRSDAVSDRAKVARGVHHDAEDMEAMRDHFRVERIAVIGHSYIGLVAALYAMTHPERVSRIVQIGPPAPEYGNRYGLDNASDPVVAQAFARVGRLQSSAEEMDPVEACERVWEALRPMYVADRKDVSKLASWGACDLANERNAMEHFNSNILPSMKALTFSPEQLTKAKAPVLTIHGTRDRNAPYGGGRHWAMLLPNARLVTIENAAHAPWVEAPEKVFDAIDVFLKGSWPEGAEKIKSEADSG